MSARWCLALSALLVASAANAQERTECDENNWGGWFNGPRARVCEVRELTEKFGRSVATPAEARQILGLRAEA